MKYLLALVCLAFTLSGCTKSSGKKSFWIYTSLYQHVHQDLNEKLKARFPDVEFKWYQAGSENVAAKVNAELLAGKTQADLILTSDPFWYEDLKRRNVLLSYESPQAKAVSANLRDPDSFYNTVRVPVMVIAYHSDAVADADLPRSFTDLTKSKYKDKVAMGSPLESGTTFTAVAMLSRKLGWDYFSKLRANGAIATGGNSAVLGRIETKERPIGIVLLENVLAAARKNPKIKAVYPSEGAILVPSPIAITKTTSDPELAKKVYDFFYDKEAQDSIVLGEMYSPLPNVASPPQAKLWKDVLAHAQPWSSKILHEIYTERDTIKKNFSKVMLE